MNKENVTLVICDGLGLSTELAGNAFTSAQTPTFDYLFQNYPVSRLLSAGSEVGLDMGEPGNSEVGHLTLGTGQVLPQAFQIINASIKSDAYRTNKAFLWAMEKAKQEPSSTLHLVGLVSSGGVHCHIVHMLAFLLLAKDKGLKRVAIDAISDGRDTSERVVLDESKALIEMLKQFPFGVINSVGGRFYALDRDTHWERTDAFYWAMFGKSHVVATSLNAAILQGYGRGESDENIQPITIVDNNGAPLAPLRDNDVVILTNYRPDRIRQLAARLITVPTQMNIICMTDYFLGKSPEAVNPKTQIMSAYPLPKPSVTLASVLAHGHKSQLHIAETEKYAHITYFLNGHQEKKHPLEEWLLIPSLRVASFDMTPEMSAPSITNAYIQAKTNHPADFTVVNYANMDMVAHTGNYQATILAVTNVDLQLRTIVNYAESKGEWLIITADHGNCEQMINPITHEIDKEHTTNPVPIIFVHPKLKQTRTMDKFQLAVLSNVGMLADVAPTILAIMGINKPSEMVGSNLLEQI